MIRFKITSCPSAAQIREYRHDANNLVLGLSDGDMIIDDPSFGHRQAHLYLKDGQAFLESLNPQCMVQINGQKIIVGKPYSVKEKDIFLIGQTTIILSEISDRSENLPPPPWESTETRKRLIPGTKEYAIYNALAHLAKHGLKPKSEPTKPPTS